MEVGLPVLAQQRFSQGAAAFGSVVAAFGVGATIGVIGSGLRRVAPRMGRLAIGAMAWLGAGLGLLGLPGSGWDRGRNDGPGDWCGGHRRPDLAASPPDEAMRGRVLALVLLASFGTAPLALALAGLLTTRHVGLIFGLGAAMILFAAGGAAVSRTVRSL